MHRHTLRLMGAGLLAVAWSGCGASPPGSTVLPTPYPFITATPQPQPVLPQQDTQPAPSATTDNATDPLPTPPITVSPESADSRTPTAPARPGEGCRYQPTNVFAQVYQGDPGLPPSLGCAVGQTPSERPRLWPVAIDFQTLERGYMLWVSNLGWIKSRTVFVMLDDQSLSRFEDTFNPAKDLSTSSATPPVGLLEPQGALGKVWRTQPDLSQRIGFAVAPASRAETQMQMFEYGQMIYAPASDQVIVLKQGQIGSWTLHAVNQ